MNNLVEAFKAEVADNAHLIDPNKEEDWYSLTVGWAIAKGVEPNKAREFATFIRYKTDLG